MSERPAIDDSEEAQLADGVDAEAPPPRRRRRLFLMAAAAVFLTVAAAGGGFYMWSGSSALLGTAGDSARAAKEPVVFYPLPELIVSLDDREKRAAFMKLRVTLELPDPAEQDQIERMLPRIVDFCQIYLREVRVEDIRGSAGTMRLRAELLRRIRAAVAPARVNDVLFAEMLIH